MALLYFKIFQVRPFEKDVERRYSAGGGLVTQHINSMLDTAYRYSYRKVTGIVTGKLQV